MDLVRDFSDDDDLESQAILICASCSDFQQKSLQRSLPLHELDRLRHDLILRMLQLIKLVRNHVEEGEEESEDSEQMEASIEPSATGEKIDTVLVSEEQKEKNTRPFSSEKGRSYKKDPNVIFACQQLKKTFSKNGFSLSEINLELKLGEITGLVGENGNGKTTLFRILTGELEHDGGRIYYPAFGEVEAVIDWFHVKNQIAYVPQELPKWWGSLEENILFEASVRRLESSRIKQEMKFIVHRLGLETYLNRKWGELSGGYKLRFSLAKALVWRPRFLILDEPLANLDVNTQLNLLNDLRDLAKGAKFPISIIFSSQHLREVESISDKIIFLRKGSIKFYGTKADLGKERAHNTFELMTDLSYEELILAMEEIPILHLEDNGLEYVITTPLDYTAEEFLKELSHKEVSIEYFRNISISTRTLFNS